MLKKIEISLNYSTIGPITTGPNSKYFHRKNSCNTLYQNCTNCLGRVAQSVTCLATDASLTADPGVASSILVRSHTFVEIDYEIISTLPLNHSRRIVVRYNQKYVHIVLVNCLLKLAQE